MFYDVKARGKEVFQRVFGDENGCGHGHVCSSVGGTPDRGPRGEAVVGTDAWCYCERPVVEEAASKAQYFVLFLVM